MIGVGIVSNVVGTYMVELEVETAGVAHGHALHVAPPQSGVGALAIGATGAHPTRCRLETSFRLD